MSAVNRNDENDPPEAREARLAALRKLQDLPKKRDTEDISDLPRWAKVGIARKELLGESWKEAGASVNRSAASLSEYGASPAGKRWREQLAEVADDPKTLVESMLKGTALSVTLDYLLAYERAITANDYKETGIMARDLLDRFGVTKKQEKSLQAPSQIVIMLPGGASLEVPTVTSEHKQLPGKVDADFEIEEDGN